jgi:hypothetical protein
MGWVFNATLRPLYPRERAGTHYIGGWVGPTAGLNGCRKSRSNGIRSPDLPTCSGLLYRLSYLAHSIEIYICEKLVKASDFRVGNSEMFTLPIIQPNVWHLSANYFSD